MIDLEKLEKFSAEAGLRSDCVISASDLKTLLSLARSAEALRGEVERWKNYANSEEQRAINYKGRYETAESSLAAVKGALEKIRNDDWRAGDTKGRVLGKYAQIADEALSTLTRQEKP